MVLCALSDVKNLLLSGWWLLCALSDVKNLLLSGWWFCVLYLMLRTYS